VNLLETVHQGSIIKHVVVSLVFRYAKELDHTRWNGVRIGAVLGLFIGWLSLVTYLLYSIGFIFGSLLMSYDNQNTFDVSDILSVSDSYLKLTKK